MKKTLSRRMLLLNTAAMAMSAPLAQAAKLAPTPAQTAGPFYPTELPLDDDNDLTRVQGRNGIAKGGITDLTGRIVDINDNPLEGIRIEIWQCDANGRYRHPYDTRDAPVDENFQGHGHAVTDARGEYRFRTIRPVPYPGRTPHIHVAVLPRGERPFVTQLYVEDEPRNRDDFLFNRVESERRHLVVAGFNASDRIGLDFEARFNIIIDRIGGTPPDT